MKATLLIKNISSLYTCDSLFTVLHDAFIAVHHDRIIDLGTHSWTEYVEDCTRVFDATGQCVVPAFIDAGFAMKPAENRTYLEMDTLYHLQQNGILTLLSRDPRLQRKTLEQDVLVQRHPYSLPLISTLEEWLQQQPSRFLLSCASHGNGTEIVSPFPLIYTLYTTFDVKEETLLTALTSLPALEGRLGRRGRLQPGYLADLLVLQGPDLHACFSVSGKSPVRRMIKRGIPIYPQMMRA